MSNHNAIHSRILRIFFVALFAISGLASCGGGVAPTAVSPVTSSTTYTITSSAGGHGTISPTGATTVNQGASRTYTITPSAGYTIATLAVDGSSITPRTSYTFSNTQANHTISATFSLIASTTFRITASAVTNGSLTPTGVTTVNQGAAQTYTITPNSGYTTATLTVDGTPVPTSSSYTFSNVQANHTIGAAFILIPAGNNIVPSLVPARTSGVAPLSVFFDASATTDAGITRPFHDLEYTWNFGDTDAGTWAYGTKPGVGSKNAATGPVAAHVFETAGTYDVSVTVFDGTYTATTHTTITVQDPDVIFAGTNTICVGSGSIPVAGANGCPAGASVYQQSNFATAVNSYAHTGRRLLFRRGDTFTAPSSGVLDETGPGIIGAFGTGALPVVQRTGSSSIMMLSSQSTPTIKDWRIMDLDFDGRSTIQESNIGIDSGGGINQVLILRMNMRNMYRGVSAGPWILNALNSGTPKHSIFEEWAVVDSTMSGIPGCNGPNRYICDWRVYLAGKKHSIQGNLLDNQDTGGSHVIRSEYMAKGVISNNDIARAGEFQMAIKLHAWGWQSGGVADPGAVGTYSEQVIISDNKIIGGVNPWTISLGPQNDTSDERVRDVIVERNWFTAGSGTQLHMHINSSETTIRNNICDLTGAVYHTCIAVVQWGTTPDNVRIYNNTFYSRSSGDFYGVTIDNVSSHVSVINNLGSAPNTTDTPVMITGTGTSGSQSNNSTNAQLKSTAPGWATSPPSVPADFKLTTGSYALGAAGSVPVIPVYSDFFLQRRLTNDLGAAEK